MDKATQRYLATLDKLLGDYAFQGIQALALVPQPLIDTAIHPQPTFCVNFRKNGELHCNNGTYSQHLLMLAMLNARGK